MHKLLSVLLLLAVSFHASSQFQVGAFAGLSNYQGDIVDKVYKQSKFAAGVNVGYAISPRLTLRAGVTFGKIAGADSLNSKPALQARNLSFESALTEVALRAEFYSFNLESTRWSPYIFGGVAFYHFNPYTHDRLGNQVFLKPLSTEGQGLPGSPDSKPYSLTQLSIPFGGGIKYMLTDNFGLGFEIGLRKTFTDNLDDVSKNYADQAELLAARGQTAVDLSYRGDERIGGNPAYPGKNETRGSPKYKDYYYFTGLQITYHLPEGDRGNAKSRKGGYGCPVF